MKLTENEMYRRLHSGNAGDLEFYGRVIEGAERILELGCGWGRLSLPLARGGAREFVGIDSNRDFLAAAREQARAERLTTLRFEEQDIRALGAADNGRLARFDRIILPYNALYCLGGSSGVAACFRSVRECLAPAGEFWLDVYPVDQFHAYETKAVLEGNAEGSLSSEDDDQPVAVWQETEGKLEVWERSDHDPKKQRLDVEYLALDERGRVVGRHGICHEYLTSTQVFEQLDAAGLSVEMVLGSFDGRPFDDDAEQVVVAARLS